MLSHRENEGPWATSSSEAVFLGVCQKQQFGAALIWQRSLAGRKRVEQVLTSPLLVFRRMSLVSFAKESGKKACLWCR